MIRSYLRLAARTLRRRIGYTAVNALGLTVGLACCALVAVFLQYELTYDAHHKNAERIYRIISSQLGDEDFSTIIFGRGNASGDAQRAYAEQLVAEVPEIEQATNYVILDDPRFVTTNDGDTFESERQLATNTGPAFADLFTFERIVGAAFLVGAPLAWWAASTWLGQFANRVGVSPLVFVGTGLGALALAVLAVSTQALRAARVDPATVLRSE